MPFSLRQQHAKEKFSIYLAVTTYCRTWQLQAALPLCFLSTLPHRNTVTWVIADCNDRTDRESEVSTWLRRRVPAVLQLQHVFYFQRGKTDNWTGWDSSRAKNSAALAVQAVSHALGEDPSNVVLVNVDNDQVFGTLREFVAGSWAPDVHQEGAEGGLL